MAFTGSVPKLARHIVQQELDRIDRKAKIHILCSGNFTIDKMAHSMGFKVTSNDISIYSKVIADYVLNQKTEFGIKDPDLSMVYHSWPKEKEKDLVFLLYLTQISKFSKKNNVFQVKNYERYLHENLSYFETNVSYLREKEVLNFEIEDYVEKDFVEYAREIQGGYILMYPPTYKGGYERLYSFINDVIEYDFAPYEVFDSKLAGPFYSEILNSKNALIYTDIRFEEIEKYLIGEVNMGKAHDIYIYSSFSEKRYYFINGGASNEVGNLKTVDKNNDLQNVNEISIKELDSGTMNAYKDMYMSAKVDYSYDSGDTYGFFLNGELFGFVSFNRMFSSTEDVFMKTDFIVPSAHKRASKLILFLTKSNEIRSLLVDKYKNYYKGVKTTVFTKNPVSMKYRGVYDLRDRKKDRLIYRADFNEKSLIENYSEWKKRYKKAK